MKLSEIKALKGLYIEHPDIEIFEVTTLENVNKRSICYCLPGNEVSGYYTEGTVIYSENSKINDFPNINIIISPNPKLTMAKVILECFNNENIDKVGYTSPPFKHDDNCAIGKPGFGYIWDENHWLRFPHIGGVLIEYGVELGSNVCIDRGSIGDTIIHEGVKIDNLVHIAHNAEIGKNTLIVAGSVIGGSCKIGENCFIGMNVSIKNKIKIGNNVTIGAGAVVVKDVPDGETWAGVPAKKIK